MRLAVKVTQHTNDHSRLIPCQRVLWRQQECTFDAASTSNKNMHLPYYYSSWSQLFTSRLFATCGHLSLNVHRMVLTESWNHSDPLLSIAIGSGCYLNSAYRRVHICLCDGPVFHRRVGGCERHNLRKKKKNNIPPTAVLIIHIRRIVRKCYFCVFCHSPVKSWTDHPWKYKI